MVILLLTLGLTILVSPAAAAGDVSVSISAPDEVESDSDFTASIDITVVEELNAVQYDICFDPAVLRLDDITDGEIGSSVIKVMFNEISPGKVRVIQSMGLGTVEGSGHLATLHFHSLQAGQSNIELSDGLLSGWESEIQATWLGDSANVISTDAGEQGTSSTTPPPEETATEPELETGHQESLPELPELPETTGVPIESATTTTVDVEFESTPVTNIESESGPPSPPHPSATRTRAEAINWPVLGGAIGGGVIVIIAGLIIFFQIKRRFYVG